MSSSEQVTTAMTPEKLREVQEWLRPRLSPADFDHAMKLLRQKYLIPSPTNDRRAAAAADQLIRMFERKRRAFQ
jgi:hypothetical protein